MHEPERNCRICGHAPLRFVKLLHGELWHDDVPLLACAGCASWLTIPERFEGEAELGRVNSVAWHLQGLAYNQCKVRALFDLLEERGWATPPGRFLDIGCALGHAVAEAQRRGYAAVGFEPEPTAAEYARRVMNVDVECRFFVRGARGEAPFDVIVLDNVLEHVTHPRDLVQDIADSLSPQGVLFLGVPPVSWLHRWTSVSWCMPAAKPTRDWRGRLARSRSLGFLAWRDTFGFPDGHINYFSGRAVALLAAQHGLRVEQQFHPRRWRARLYPWLGLTSGFWILRKRG